MATKVSISPKSTKTKRNVAPPKPEVVSSVKRCSRCLKVKPISEFHKNRAMKDGYEAKCKVCTHYYFAKWYENNRERVAKNTKAWSAAHPDKVRKYHEAYRKGKKAKGVNHGHN